jgi:hypothetical protein
MASIFNKKLQSFPKAPDFCGENGCRMKWNRNISSEIPAGETILEFELLKRKLEKPIPNEVDLVLPSSVKLQPKTESTGIFLRWFKSRRIF